MVMRVPAKKHSPSPFPVVPPCTLPWASGVPPLWPIGPGVAPPVPVAPEEPLLPASPPSPSAWPVVTVPPE